MKRIEHRSAIALLLAAALALGMGFLSSGWLSTAATGHPTAPIGTFTKTACSKAAH